MSWLQWFLFVVKNNTWNVLKKIVFCILFLKNIKHLISCFIHISCYHQHAVSCMIHDTTDMHKYVKPQWRINVCALTTRDDELDNISPCTFHLRTGWGAPPDIQDNMYGLPTIAATCAGRDRMRAAPKDSNNIMYVWVILSCIRRVFWTFGNILQHGIWTWQIARCKWELYLISLHLLWIN